MISRSVLRVSFDDEIKRDDKNVRGGVSKKKDRTTHVSTKCSKCLGIKNVRLTWFESINTTRATGKKGGEGLKNVSEGDGRLTPLIQQKRNINV